MVFLPHWPIPHGNKPIDLDLSRIRELLQRLGNPETKIPPVIHVAGTNGKGSTLAFLKAIFEDAGLRVHRYCSPHISNFNERIMLAGEEISDEFLHEVIEETRAAAGDLQTTFFEATTAAAFLAFSKVEADVVLLETGLGGRLDATNVLDKPILTIITPISEDHTEYLGDTIAKIAGEKTGIIKPGVPCVTSWQHKEAYEVLRNKCIEQKSPLYAHGEHWDFTTTDGGFSFFDEEHYPFPKPGLHGIHQIVNAATAVAAVRCLEGFSLSYQNIENGIRNAKWRARLERIDKGVLFDMMPNDEWELWVDGAHNNAGAQMLAATLDTWEAKPTYLINGRTKDRDIESFLEHFKDKVEFVCGVKVESEPNGELAKNIVNGANNLGFTTYECSSIKDAIAMVQKQALAPGRIVICGSLYLAGDVMLANRS